MIDLDDLQDLLICRKCKCVYMPDFYESSPYDPGNCPRNGSECRRCEQLKDIQERKDD